MKAFQQIEKLPEVILSLGIPEDAICAIYIIPHTLQPSIVLDDPRTVHAIAERHKLSVLASSAGGIPTTHAFQFQGFRICSTDLTNALTEVHEPCSPPKVNSAGYLPAPEGA